VSPDPAVPPAAPASTTTSYDPDWSRYTRFAAVAAVAGVALYLIFGFINLSTAHGHETEAKQRFALSYLTGFIYWFSLPIGGMALLMIGYLAKSSWGLLLRRPMEAATRTLPLMFVLFLLLAAFASLEHFSPYWWRAPHDAHAPEGPSAMPEASGNKREDTIKAGELMIRRAVHHEREMRDKGNFGFLSVPAFIGVGIVLFVIWGTLIYFLNKWGKDASDEHDTAKVDRALKKLENISGPGVIIFAITVTAASTQWVMSLEPGWASTMFPVIFAVNQFLTCFAFCLALFLLFASRPPLKDVMRPKFQLDMGTLMLAFTLFWSYTSFSQFMLVWIGNLPEEIPFFLKRSNYEGHPSGWWYVSAALIALHFALPFLLLLFRDIKLHPVRLRVVAVYLLIICAVDVTWWIQPSVPHYTPWAVFMDLGAIVGIGGIWGLVWVWELKKRPLLPASQVFLLPEGHHHEHH
jgi:hypothetical protein